MPLYQISDNPHPGQRRLLAEQHRFNLAVMGRRWGKTRLGLNRLVAVAGRGRPVGWFAPQYKLLDEAFRAVRQKLGPLIARQDVQQHRIELHGGGSIDFWTLESPDAGRGRKYALAVIDEAAMARNLEEAWTAAIRPTLADYQGKAWFLSTPKGNNYFKTLFDRIGDDPDWARWQLPTHDNPFILPGEIEAMRIELPNLIYQQEVLAQFVDHAGAILKREWLATGEPNGHPAVVLGVDLALSTKQDADYSAIVAMSRAPNGTLYVRDAQRIRAPFHQVLQFIQQMAAKWTPVIIAIEAVQYQAAVVQELLRTTRLPVRGVRPDKDKLTRFLPLAARYEQGLVKHTSGLPGWFEDELLAFPVGEHDDGCLVAGTLIKTNRGMVPIEKVAVGDLVMTRQGYRRVVVSAMTSPGTKVFTAEFSNGAHLTGTGNHPVMTDNGWIELQKLKKGDKISILGCVHLKDSPICEFIREKAKWLSTTESVFTVIHHRIVRHIETIFLLGYKIDPMALIFCTAKSGKIAMAASRMDTTFTIKTGISSIISLKTLSWFRHQNTLNSISRKQARDQNILNRLNTLIVPGKGLPNGMEAKQEFYGIKSMALKPGKPVNIERWSAWSAARIIKRAIPVLRCTALQIAIKKSCDLLGSIKTIPSNVYSAIKNLQQQNDKDIVPVHVLYVISTPLPKAVFNLKVEDVPEYYANGVLVHNCDALAYSFQALGMASGGPVGLKVAAL